MDQIDQENELQRAIDDITKNGGAGEPNADVAAGLEEQIQNQMGMPPVPEVPPAGEGPAEAMPPMGGEMPAEPAPMEGPVPEGAPAEGGEAPMPEAPAEGGAPAEMAPMDAPVEVPEMAVPEMLVENAENVEAVETPAVATEEVAAVELNDMGGNDINGVKEAMIRDLFPIMDKVDMGAEEKFDLYKRMLDDTNDKSLISGAYEVVKGIGDESARAEALLFLIKKADA